jgi:nicotinic acid mononucleotide adenylyltransferase
VLRFEKVIMNAALPLDDFLAERLPTICTPVSAPRPSLLLPGSFNPLHDAHCKLADLAAAQFGQPAAFELSIVNVDKPPLARDDIECRLRQFSGRAPIWLTRAPTFVEKAQLFPGVVFVVGADTAARILSPRYYRDANLDAALNEIRSHGCRFLVAGRVDATGRFLSLDDLSPPLLHRDLFAAIPADVFRMDLSSTQLRAQHGVDRR